MSEQELTVVCYECGATIRDDATDKTKCWLCGGSQFGDAATWRPQEPTPPIQQPKALSFSLETLMLTITLLAVCLGMFALFPGLGILLAIVLAPVFARTTMVVQRREAQGRPVETGQRVALFMGSFATAIVIIVTVSLASVGTFCAICLTAGEQEAIPIAGIVAAFVTILTIYLMVRRIRARWQRDTEV